jgi:glycine cleavage system aminomethyltransferase T
MIILNKLATSNFIPKHNEKILRLRTYTVWEQMLPFAGYNMPTLMKVNAEHETVRTAVGVLMCRTWENFLLTGTNALFNQK